MTTQPRCRRSQDNLIVLLTFPWWTGISPSCADKLHEVMEFLLTNESMTGEQFAACMEGKAIQEASATAMFDTPTEE